MATKNVVPRADNEGYLGTEAKTWLGSNVRDANVVNNLTVGGSSNLNNVSIGGQVNINGKTITTIVEEIIESGAISDELAEILRALLMWKKDTSNYVVPDVTAPYANVVAPVSDLSDSLGTLTRRWGKIYSQEVYGDFKGTLNGKTIEEIIEEISSSSSSNPSDFKNFQIFSGDGTYTVPAGVSKVYVSLIAAGGGGAGYAGASSSGERGLQGRRFYRIPVNVSPAETITVTIGRGGVWGASEGSQGGTTSFGTYLYQAGSYGGIAGDAYNNTPPATINQSYKGIGVYTTFSINSNAGAGGGLSNIGQPNTGSPGGNGLIIVEW